MLLDEQTQKFYDGFWPQNVPYYEETKKYMLGTISERGLESALDAGCGHGVCSVVLSEIARQVTAVDLSPQSLTTAREIAARFRSTNISFIHADLQYFASPTQYDLVWCWGVAMMAPEPVKILHNVMAATKPGGTLIWALYLKTWLSPVHQWTRHFCRRFMHIPVRKKVVLDFFAGLTGVLSWLKGKEYNLRADNVSIQAQVDDWFYPPYKTFYAPEEIISMLTGKGFTANCIQAQVGRLKSATIFVVRAVKQPLRRGGRFLKPMRPLQR